MRVSVKRRNGQNQDLQQWLKEDDSVLARVDKDGRFLGNLGGIIAPAITVNSQAAAADNAAAIQAALDAAPPGAIVLLPNDTVYTFQVNVTPANSGVTIAGGPKTVLINLAGGIFPRIFVGVSGRIAYVVFMGNYVPGDANVLSFDVFGAANGGDEAASNFIPGDVIYLRPFYFLQTVEQSRLAQMTTIASVSFPTITLTEPISTTLGATLAAATVAGGQVTAITLGLNYGTPYYRTGPSTTTPRVRITGNGSGATAVARLNAPVQSIAVTSGSGYTSAPAVSFSGGNPTTPATAVAYIDANTGRVIRVNVTNGGSGYTSVPTVSFSGGGGSGATAIADVVNGQVIQVRVTSGSGYTSAPSVTITPADGLGSGATATATVDPVTQWVTGVAVTASGSGYTQSPNVTFSGGGGSGVTALATIGPSLIDSVNVTNGGSGYTSATVAIDPPPFAAKWVKGGSKIASHTANSVTLTVPSRVSLFPVGSWAYLCTGPAFDEADGTFYRVLETAPGTGYIKFEQTIRPEDFGDDSKTCLVPGPFVQDMVFRNFKIGGTTSAQGALFLSNAVNVAIDNVQVIRSDDDVALDGIGFAGSQYIRITGCELALEAGTTHNISVEDSYVIGYRTHMFVSDADFTRCRLSSNIFVYRGSYRFTFRDCELDSSNAPNGFNGLESSDLAFFNCRIVSTGIGWGIDGPRVRMHNVRIDSGPAIELYAGCTDCVLENVTGAINFNTSSTGRYANVTPTPTGSLAGWTTYLVGTDPATVGGPLTVGGTATVGGPLTVAGTASLGGPLTVGGTATVGGNILANGSATITSNPPTAGAGVGWKFSFYLTDYALGIASATLALKAQHWLSLFNGNPANNGSTTTPDGNAHVSLNAADGSIWFGTNGRSGRLIALTRTLPNAVDSAVDLGSFAHTSGGGAVRVSAAVSDTGFSVAKVWELPFRFDGTAGAWQVALPLSDTGAYTGGGGLPNDYALDLSASSGTTSLRLRRTAVDTVHQAGTASVLIEFCAPDGATWTPSTSSGAVTAPTVVYPASQVTQVGSKVGVNAAAPAARLHVLESTAGSAVQRLETETTGDNPTLEVRQTRVTTTNATTTTLWSLTLADNTAYRIAATVLARQTGGTGGSVGSSAFYVREALVKRTSGGNAVLVGTVQPIATAEDQDWDCTIGVVGGGNAAEVRVTGAANNDVTWHLVKCEVSPLSS
jgi:hypothetical protein